MMNFWVYGWAALGIYFCSSDLVQLCFGEEYVLADNIPFVLALNFFSVGMMNAVWTYKHTLGLFHYGRFIQFFTGILNVVFSVILGTYWGLFGILFATFLARLCTSLWYDPYAVFSRGFGKSPMLYAGKIAKYIIVLLTAAILCKLSTAMIGGSLLFKTLLKMVVCSVVANGVFLAAFSKTPEFAMLKRIIAQVWEKVLSRR